MTRAELAHLAWSVPPLVVLALANLLFDLAGTGYGRLAQALTAIDDATPTLERSAALAAAVLAWSGLALVYLVVSVGALLGAWRIMSARVRGRARRPFMALALAASLLGFANLVLVDALDLPMRAIFHVTAEAITGDPRIPEARAIVAIGVVVIINVLSVIVPAVFIAAGAATALPPSAGWNETTLCRRATQLRQIVAIAAAFMVAGVLHMGGWTQLAGATLDVEAEALLDRAALAVTLFWGTAFTLMIVSFYVPLAVRLSELAEQVMDSMAVPVSARRAWRAERGLSFEIGRQLPQIAAMAAPLLAGPLTAAVNTSAKLLAP